MPTSPLALAVIEKARAEQATFVDLGNCGLIELPDELFALTDLVGLNLGVYYWKDSRWQETGNKMNTNKLTSSHLSRLKVFNRTLRTLYLRYTKITDISVLAQLPQLQTLDLSRTDITDIGVLAQLPRLQTLHISNTSVTDISVLARLPQLQTLHMRSTGTTDISSLAQLPLLHTLYLSNTSITDISVLAQLPQLQTLFLRYTGIANIDVLAKLPQLHTLDVSYTGITDVGVLAKLPQLHTLFLRYTSITNISVLAKLLHLQELDLSYTGITDINDLTQLHQLQTLHLRYTSVTDIDGIAQLSQLQTIDLSFMSITDISVLVRLPQLKTLYLSNTCITDINVLAQLPQLRTLDLSRTDITDISILAQLPQLQTLDLSRTDITDISILAQLPQLQTLDLSHTDITDISVIAKLSQLQTLDLNRTGANAAQITFVVLNSPNLISLSLNQGIEGIPEGLESDLAGLRDFFQKQRKDVNLKRSEPNRSLKLILLGNTRAGKSQLLNRFLGRSFQNNSESTDGLKVEIWSPTIQGITYRITCFDFGGQDFYHATHNLYLDNRAIYLVLWHPHVVDPDQHLPLGYWLGNITYFTESGTDHNMAVWSIQSRADEAFRDWKESEQMALYGTDPDGRFYISVQEASSANSRWQAEWNYFRQSLDRKIQALAQNVTASNYEIIAVRDEVLPRLREQKRLVLPRNAFDKECAENKTLMQAGPSDYSSTLRVLQAAGELLWYSDLPSVVNYIIVDPAGWADFIFKVLDRDIMARNDGEFDRQSLEKVIKKSNIHEAEKALLPNLFITLLQEYQLIFEKPGVENCYVVPQFLPEQQLEQYLKKLIPLTFILAYEHYMPFWRITHFITQKATAMTGSKTHYWRSGIIYEELDCTVMVRVQRLQLKDNESATEVAEGAEAKLYIHVEGPAEHRIQALTEILDFFGRAHRFRKSNSRMDEEIIKQIMPGENWKERIDQIVLSDKPSFIRRIAFSVNDRDFFTVDGLLEALETKQKLLKTKAGSILPIPALFYPLLNYQNSMPKRIFFSYAHADAQYRRELDVHFAALKRGQYVETWHDMEILPGQYWHQHIGDEINKADLVLALISPDFMNSSYIWDHEISKMGKKFVPIFLRPCDFDETIITPVQGLPKHYEAGDNNVEKGIRWIVSSKWTYRDEAYLAVIDGLKRILKQPSKS